MKFKVRFKAKDGWSVEVKQREIGLREVRAIRVHLEVDNLSLERIQGWVDSLHRDPVIVVSEEQAAKVGEFQRKNNITVTGERNFLSHHVHPQVGCSRNEKTGEIEEACLFPKVWEEAVLEEWFCLGCPLEWPSKTESD